MKEIKEFDLKDLVKEASEIVLKERGDKIVGIIRKTILKAEQLKKDILSLNKELNQKSEKLTKMLDLLDKAKNGDWSVLKEENNNQTSNEDY